MIIVTDNEMKIMPVRKKLFNDDCIFFKSVNKIFLCFVAFDILRN